jgi:transposase
MDQLSLFTAALGLQAPWEVVDVRFDPQGGRIDFDVAFARGAQFPCPHCGASGQAVHDTRERTWRHLNFFQFQAYLHAKVPRVRCADCQKISQVPVPWARASPRTSNPRHRPSRASCGRFVRVSRPMVSSSPRTVSLLMTATAARP